jgi:hypothetical protein
MKRAGFILLLAANLSPFAPAAALPDEALPPPLDPPAEDLIPAMPKRDRPPRPPANDWAQWNSVTGFRGQSRCRRISQKFYDSGTNVERGSEENLSTGTFLFKRGPAGRFDLVSGHIVGSFHADYAEDRWSYHGRSGKDAAFSGPSTQFILALDTLRGTWRFQTNGDLVDPYELVSWLNSRNWMSGAWEHTNRRNSERKNDSAHFSTDDPLPRGRPTPLHDTWDYTHGTLKTGLSDFHGEVWVAPEYQDLELIVELDGLMPGGRTVAYAEWLPRGTPTGAAGSRLKVTARLQSRDGSRVVAKVENFSFTLNGTSREPGLCLNFPRLAAAGAEAPAAPDLKFMPGGETDAERQQLDMLGSTNDDGQPYAETRIDCFDFGAWSDLTVTAELNDGRVITGHLKGDQSIIVIPLPKRSGGSYIADAWKTAHGITAGDTDDAEKLPSVGKAPGDGLTLYEEYRGFIENGKHLEGDPQKIDFFVRNYIGGDARPGIELFGELTGAEVHHRLRGTEFDPTRRVMNANRHQGPHRVDQHGVYVRTEAGRDGATAVFNQAGVRGRPKLCTGIFVQPREAETSLTTSENVPAADLIFAYDRAIVHELLHAVGVEHHGHGDYQSGFQLVFADDPRNKAGKPVFWIGSTERIANITDEATGRDLAAMLAPDLMLAREYERERFFDSFQARTRQQIAERRGTLTTAYTEDQIVDMFFNDIFGNFRWYVGADHGECSGDEDCVTRYTFAKLYEKKGVPYAYYYIGRMASERAGLDLCAARTGTGVNAPGRKPQPRYGDTLYGWGECSEWIVFNDAVPPEPEPQ